MLYILNRSPYLSDFKSVLRIINCNEDCNDDFNDDLLLISDGVILGLNNSFFSKKIKNSMNIYALKNDIEARGLFSYYLSNIKLIDYIDFIKLTEKNLQQVTW
ncbi:sulfurtransferase complex subunit TusB [secondary endosymbiont of Trabutina mannipara]|nr:sulfurtransferase complex subunit TusB [secondary endosymbiont of Trabutina mannipara]